MVVPAPPGLRVALIFALVIAAIGGSPTEAAAQLRTRIDGNGVEWITNPVSGKAAAVQPLATTGDVAAVKSAQSTRPSAYDELIREHAAHYDVNPGLVRAVVQVESNFNPSARSPKGAMGLMQLMPATAQQFGVANPFDPSENIRGGTAYLRQLLDRYANDKRLALAAYNAGPGAVDKYGETVPPYRETREYVARVNEASDDEDGPARPRASGKIYKIVEIKDGREVVTYTNVKPKK
jgi:soluble lytic murein transglycosylase-like protein